MSKKHRRMERKREQRREQEEKRNIQIDKMKNALNTMPSALKDKIVSCLNTMEMQEYTREHFEDICAVDLLPLIVGSPRPIAFKAELVCELAGLFPHPFEELDDEWDFEYYVKLYQDAFADMQVSSDEKALYMLVRYYCDYVYDAVTTFFTFENALGYIEIDKKKKFFVKDNGCIWYEIRKLVGEDVPTLKSVYTVSRQGEIWGYCYAENYPSNHPFGYSHVCRPWIKVPFSIGDVVTLDCRPFMPLRHGVIISDDRCFLYDGRCLYLTKDGFVTDGALRFSSVFDCETPRMSVIYNAKRYHGELPLKEAFMPELGVEFAKLYQMDPEKYGEKCAELLHACNHWLEVFGDEPENLLRAIRAEQIGDDQELERILSGEV